MKITMWATFLNAVVLVSCFVSSCGCVRNNAVPTASTPLGRISVRGKWLVDSDGRVRVFHGWNSVLKSPPWYDDNILNETQLAIFKQMGFNAVRLGAMWTGFEPSKDQFNATYIIILQNIVKKLEKYGIYALLDMHQDVISTKFDSYDGAPRWVIDSFPDSVHPYPWPLKKVTAWAEGYLTEAVGNAFQCLYDNVNGGRDALVKFWQKVASVFKDQTSILGYEMINEPWAGGVYDDPTLFTPGEAGKRNLQPLYEHINTGIRKIDNNTLLFYEPVTWGMLFNGKVLGSGFSHVPGGDLYKNRSVFSYHYYCWILTGNMSQPYPIGKKILCDDLLEPKVFNAVMADLDILGGSSFLTEYGLCTITDDPESEDSQECNAVMRLADKYVQSWTYWDSQFFDAHGAVVEPAVKGFSRAYPRATAGTPLTMSYDPTSAEFQYDFVMDTTIKAPTEVFVPPFHYPKGPKVAVTNGLKWTYSQEDNLVYVLPVSRDFEFNSSSRITMVPAK
ncbi:endoglycoceramidase-like [Lineus longissimus]|uniref:endoglycoceramidase-like n=1 Tax=Lineus longissimus TaxID=88925 RepID=UPI002B4D8EBD